MQHAEIQYGPGTAPALHPSHYNAVDVAHPAVPSGSSTTSVLRSWRKKDAVEKAPPTEPTPSTPAAENQGPVARVAPHTHYHKPSSNHNYQPVYSDYSMQTPPIQQAAPVKYSEIIEPLQGMDHLSSALPKPKEKTYVDMCNIQAKPYQEPNYKYNNVQFKDQYPFLQKESSQYLQKDHMAGYIPKEGGNFPQYMPPNYKMQYSRNFQQGTNEFLASLKQIAPHMAQDILNDTHLHDTYSVYPPMEQNRVYQQQRMYQRTPPMHSNPNYQQRPIPQNYNHFINQQRMSSNGYRMYPQQNLRYQQIPNDIPPRHQFHDVNYGPMPPRISPSYPPCNQMEYSQHYQHRQVPLRQEFMPMPNKSFIETHPEIPEIVPEESLHQPNKSLKRFLETWSEDHTVEESDEADKHPRQNNKENTLYVFDAMDIPSENIPQFLHLQSIDKLPSNIRGFYTEGLPQNKNCSMSEGNKGTNVDSQRNEDTSSRTGDAAMKSNECLQMGNEEQRLQVDGGALSSTQRRKDAELNHEGGARKNVVEKAPKDFNLPNCSKQNFKENQSEEYTRPKLNDDTKPTSVTTSVILQNNFANQTTSNNHDECFHKKQHNSSVPITRPNYDSSDCLIEARCENVEAAILDGLKSTTDCVDSNLNQCAVVGNYSSAKQHEITKHNVSDILNDHPRVERLDTSPAVNEENPGPSEAELRYSVISKWKAKDFIDDQAEVKHLKSSQENVRDQSNDSSKSELDESNNEEEPNSINDAKLNRQGGVSLNEIDSYDESPINLSSSQNVDKSVIEKGNFSSIFNVAENLQQKISPQNDGGGDNVENFTLGEQFKIFNGSSKPIIDVSADTSSESSNETTEFRDDDDSVISQDDANNLSFEVPTGLEEPTIHENNHEVALDSDEEKSKGGEAQNVTLDAPKHLDELPIKHLDEPPIKINEESSNIISSEEINVQLQQNIDDKLYKKLTHKEVDKLTDDLQGLIDTKIHDSENSRVLSRVSDEADGANWYLLRIANELIQINITEEDGKKVISVTPITKVKVVTNVEPVDCDAASNKSEITANDSETTANDARVTEDVIENEEIILPNIENDDCVAVINFEDIVDGGILESEEIDSALHSTDGDADAFQVNKIEQDEKLTESEENTEIGENFNLHEAEIVQSCTLDDVNDAFEIGAQTNRQLAKKSSHRKTTFRKNYKLVKFQRRAIHKNKILLRRKQRAKPDVPILNKKVKFNLEAPTAKTNVARKSILKKSKASSPEKQVGDEAFKSQSHQPQQKEIIDFLDESDERHKIETKKLIKCRKTSTEQIIDLIEDVAKSHDDEITENGEISTNEAIDICDDRGIEIKPDVIDESLIVPVNTDDKICGESVDHHNVHLETSVINSNQINSKILDDKRDTKQPSSFGPEDTKNKFALKFDARRSEATNKSSKISFEIRRNSNNEKGLQRKISKLKESFKDALHSNRLHKEVDVKIYHENKSESNITTDVNEAPKFNDESKSNEKHSIKQENMNLKDTTQLKEPRGVVTSDFFRNLFDETDHDNNNSNGLASKVKNELAEHVTKSKDELSFGDDSKDLELDKIIELDPKQIDSTIDVTFKDFEMTPNNKLEDEKVNDLSFADATEICKLNEVRCKVEITDGCDIGNEAKGTVLLNEFSIKNFFKPHEEKLVVTTDEKLSLETPREHENTFDLENKVTNKSNVFNSKASPTRTNNLDEVEIKLNSKNALPDPVESLAFKECGLMNVSSEDSKELLIVLKDIKESIKANKTNVSRIKKSKDDENDLKVEHKCKIEKKSTGDVSPRKLSFEIPTEISNRSFKEINNKDDKDDSSIKIEAETKIETGTVNNNLDESATCKLARNRATKRNFKEHPCREYSSVDEPSIDVNELDEQIKKAKRKKVSFAEFPIDIPNRLHEEISNASQEKDLKGWIKRDDLTDVKVIGKQSDVMGRENTECGVVALESDSDDKIARQSIETRIEKMFSPTLPPCVKIETDDNQNKSGTPNDLFRTRPREIAKKIDEFNVGKSQQDGVKTSVDSLHQIKPKMVNNFNFVDKSKRVDVGKCDRTRRNETSNNSNQAKISCGLNSEDMRTNRRRLSLQEYHNRKKIFNVEEKSINEVIPNVDLHKRVKQEMIKIDFSTPSLCEGKKSKPSIRSVIEEKLNSLESFLPKVNKSPVKGTKTEVSRKLDELFATTPINFEPRTSEHLLIQRFFNHEVLTPDEIKIVRQIVQSKRALEEIKAKTNPDKRRKSFDFGVKSVNIDFDDFDIQSHFPTKTQTVDELIVKREPIGVDLNRNFSVYMGVQPNCTLGDLDQLHSKVGDFLQSSKDMKINRDWSSFDSEESATPRKIKSGDSSTKNITTDWSKVKNDVTRSLQSSQNRIVEVTNHRSDDLEPDLSSKVRNRSESQNRLEVKNNRNDNLKLDSPPRSGRSNESMEKDLQNKVDDFLQSLKGAVINRSEPRVANNSTMKNANETIEAQNRVGNNLQNKPSRVPSPTYRNNRNLTSKNFTTKDKDLPNKTIGVPLLSKDATNRTQELTIKAVVVKDNRSHELVQNDLRDSPQSSKIKNHRSDLTSRNDSSSKNYLIANNQFGLLTNPNDKINKEDASIQKELVENKFDEFLETTEIKARQVNSTTTNESSLKKSVQDKYNQFPRSNETKTRRIESTTQTESSSKNDLVADNRQVLGTNVCTTDQINAKDQIVQNALVGNKSQIKDGDCTPQLNCVAGDLAPKNKDLVVGLCMKSADEVEDRSNIVRNRFSENKVIEPQSKYVNNNHQVESKLQSDLSPKNADLLVDLCVKDTDKTEDRSSVIQLVQTKPQSKCINQIELKSQSDVKDKIIPDGSRVIQSELLEKSHKYADSLQTKTIKNHQIKSKTRRESSSKNDSVIDLCVSGEAKTGCKFVSEGSPKSPTSERKTPKATSPLTKASVKSFLEANVVAPTKLNTKAALKSFQDLPHSIVTNSPNLKSKLNTFLDICRKTIEKAGPNQEDRVKEIEDIVYKMSPNLTPKLKTTEKIAERKKHELHAEPKSNLKLLLKIPSEKKRKRKRFRNLYTADDSDEEPPAKVCDVDKSSDDVPDYSVYQRKTPAGVPKLIITRRKSGFRQSLEPRVEIVRLESIELMVKRRRRTIRLARR